MKAVCLVLIAAAVVLTASVEAVPMGRVAVGYVDCAASYHECSGCIGFQTENGRRANACHWDFESSTCQRNPAHTPEANCSGMKPNGAAECEKCEKVWKTKKASMDAATSKAAAAPVVSASGAKAGEKDGDAVCAAEKNNYYACTHRKAEHRGRMAYCKITAAGACHHEDSAVLKKAGKVWGMMDDQDEWKAANKKATAAAAAAAPAPAAPKGF